MNRPGSVRLIGGGTAHTQGMMLPGRKRGLRRAPRSRAGKLAVLALAAGVMGYISARFIVLLAPGCRR